MEEASPGQETLMPNDKEFELDDLESFSFDDLSLDETPPAAEPAAGEDPFGVWVKSAPEDVGPDSEPLDSPPAQDSLPEEDFLSSEELANLDDSFDFVTVSEEPLEGETPLEDEIAFLDTPEAVEAEKAAAPEEGTSFDEVSLDDFVSFDDAPMEDVPAFISEVPSAADGPLSDDDLNEEFLDIDIDIEDDIGDEELEIIEGAAPRVPDETETVSLDSFSAQDVDLSEFGDFEEVVPVSAGPLAQAEDLPEVMDIPELPELNDDIELPEETQTALAPADDGFFEETLLEDPLPVLVDEGHVPLDLEPDDQTDLDHIMALEEDLTSGIRSDEPAPGPASPSPAPPSDLAALILGKIEQELSSIKQEITELKREVTHLRTVPAPSPAPAAEEPVLPESAEPASKPHGFFDEEDDETIALTGDELDNILSTAEISEGEEQGLSLDEDLLGMDAEGNLLEPPAAPETADDLHVTDEEFLSGTALDLNEPDPLAEDDFLGIPESIELEEGLPQELEEGETEDLLTSDASAAEGFEVEPLPHGVLEGEPEPLEIPFDEDIGLDSDEVPLAPELVDPAADTALEPLPDFADLGTAVSDTEGWSPSELPVEDELPPPPAAPAASSGSLSPGLKDELKAVLQYMDKLLASLPDDKIQEFAESEHFEVYKRLFEELGLIE